ncbi:VWA domain-containing protein [Thalassotalea mangrovi]|uniref:VWA domain-containing protein n=1 Tax=Thalassotalea mangrovi TaxID=2572245 RepID=A0A4U1B5X1_9GAMM|nr:VWA domain-containing protein [Thalassotalea mangrovi]TKB45889.1 VWA domain-containing protein [Thalassotalea mangrovi]
MIDWASLQHFHFIRPEYLLLFLVLFALFLSFRKTDDSLRFWQQVMSSEMLEHLTVKGNNVTWFSPSRLMPVAGCLAIIVAAGPTVTQQPSPFQQDQAALVIALDVTPTMQQSDLAPSRLLRAKQKLQDLLTLRGDSATALIAYAGSAHVVMPLTRDSNMIKQFIKPLSPAIMPRSGKIAQNILPPASQLLSETQVPGTILLVTDGVSSDAEQDFQTFFASHQHQLLIWAIGDKKVKARPGADFLPLQLDSLQQLSKVSHGRMVLFDHSKDDVRAINDYINNNLMIIQDGSRPWLDAGYPLVFAVAFLYLFWFRRGWTLQW